MSYDGSEEEGRINLVDLAKKHNKYKTDIHVYENKEGRSDAFFGDTEVQPYGILTFSGM